MKRLALFLCLCASLAHGQMIIHYSTSQSVAGAPTYTTVRDTIDATDEDAGSQDVDEQTTNGYNWLGYEYGYMWEDIGYQFELAIPRGVTIDTVEVTLRIGGSNTLTTSDLVDVYCYAENTATLFDPAHTHRLKDHAARTTAYTRCGWVGESNTYITLTNLKGPLQEVIDRAGWSSGNRAGFVIFLSATPAGDEYVAMPEYSSGDPVDRATIRVVYH